MITALLVVLFSVITVLVGRLAFKSGHEKASRESRGVYSLGFEDGCGSMRLDMAALQYRLAVMESLLSKANQQSDVWKRKLSLYRTINMVLSESLTRTEAEKEKALKLLGRSIEYCNALATLVDLSELRATMKETEDENTIDGLTVELAMAEHERDEAKATIEKLLAVKVPAKVATELSRIVKAK